MSSSLSKVAPHQSTSASIVKAKSVAAKSKKRHGSLDQKKKLGWTRIQRKTEIIVSKIKEDKKKEKENKQNGKKKSKRKTVLEMGKQIGKSFITENEEKSKGNHHKDRNHCITEQIDAIRQEQIARLHSKKLERKIRDEEKHKIVTWNCIKKYTVNPKSNWKKMWDIAILMLVVFSSIQIPLLLAFPDMQPLENIVQISIDVIFIVDFGFCFRSKF